MTVVKLRIIRFCPIPERAERFNRPVFPNKVIGFINLKLRTMNLIRNVSIRFAYNFGGKMRFVELSSKLVAPWCVSDIEALVRKSAPIETVLYQPSSQITASADGVNATAPAINQDKYISFLDHIKREEPQLALTPEYSCPWSVVEIIAGRDERFPREGNLWVFGCESIKKTELDVLANRLRDQGVEVIYEDIQDVPRKFLDPICYFFWIKNEENNTVKKAILVQFKTQHMGSRGSMQPIEQFNLLEGNDVYVISNRTNSHRLITLICSEVMAFNNGLDIDASLNGKWTDNSYLILSLQLNPKTYHQEFVNFRKKILDFNNKDIICLNHALGTTINTAGIITTDGSMLCIQTNEPLLNETHIGNNHSNGCYIHKKNDSTYYFQLSNEEGIFNLHIDKPSMSGLTGAISKKHGPTVRNYMSWNGTNFSASNLPNYFELYLIELGLNGLFPGNDYLKMERLVTISGGDIGRGSSEDWFKTEKLLLIKLRADDTSQRITVVHNNEDDVGQMRQDRILRLSKLKSLVADDENFREILNLKRFMGKAREVAFFNHAEYGLNYSFNLVLNNGEELATVLYLGLSTHPKAKETFSAIKNLFKDGNKKKVVVWYLLGEQLYCLKEETYPQINDDEQIDKITG